MQSCVERGREDAASGKGRAQGQGATLSKCRPTSGAGCGATPDAVTWSWRSRALSRSVVVESSHKASEPVVQARSREVVPEPGRCEVEDERERGRDGRRSEGLEEDEEVRSK